MTMRGGHSELRSQATVLRHRDRIRRLGRIKVRERLDPALLTVLAVAIAGLASVGWTLARVEDARGVFDPPALAEVDDRRILTDYRDQPADIVDMVAHGRTAVLGRSDGAVQVYDMTRELFSDEHIPGKPALTGALSQLASSCDGNASCDPAEPLFALTETGGLAARQDGAWRTLVGDSAWIGLEGRPVEQEDLELWSVSDDGRWVLAWAGAQGLGLFDQSTSTWVDATQNGAVAAPRHMVFAHGVFWLGGDSGLVTLDPTRVNEGTSDISSEGVVLDLERTAEGNVLILRSVQCNDGASCLRIGEARGAQSIRPLLGEMSISPELTDASVEHAALQNGKFIVLGKAGVHVYDPQQRNWSVLEDAAVDAFNVGTDGQDILFAAGATVGRIQGARVVFRRRAPDRVEQILPGPKGAILALLRNGSVVDLATDDPTLVVAADPGPGNSGGMTAAAFWKDTLVFLRGKDIILHDPVKRRYAISPGAVPAGIDNGQLRMVSSSQALWLVEMSTGRVFEGTLSGAWPDKSILFAERKGPLAPLIDVQADVATLHMVDVGNRPWSLFSGDEVDPVRLVGADPPPGFVPTTAALTTAELMMSDGKTIASYDSGRRSWAGPFVGPPGGVSDLAMGPQSLLALAPDGNLYSAGTDGWTAVVGGPATAALSSADLTDAMASNRRIFLAGRGRVFAYVPEARLMLPPFTGGSGTVRLLSASGSAPLWVSGGRLLHGDTLVSGPSEKVLAAGLTDRGAVYMAEDDGRRYLVAPGAPAVCLFRGSEAPGGDLVDARLLPGGRMVVATTRTLAIYEPENRRWVGLGGRGVSSRAHFEVVSGHLVLLDGGLVRAVPLTALAHPDSCDATPQQQSWSFERRTQHAVYDPPGRRILLLDGDGSVRAWRGGLSTILPAPQQQPQMDRLLRVYRTGDTLVFAADQSIWRYQTDSRLWAEVPLSGTPEKVREVDLSFDGPRATVTVWDDAGRGFGGQEGETSVPLEPLVLPPLPRPRQPASQVLDMAATDAFVAILGERTLELFDLARRDPFATLRLPEAEVGWSLARVANASDLLLIDGTSDAPRKMLGLDVAAARRRGQAAISDLAWSYRPGTDRDWMLGKTQVWRIDAGLNLYSCALKTGEAVANTCQLAARQPSRLPPDALLAAAPDGTGGTLMLFSDRILRFDNGNRLDRQITGPDVTASGRLFRHDRGVFYWQGQGRALYRYDPSAGFTEVLPQVLDLRRVKSRLGATTPSGLMIVKGQGEPVAPSIEKQPLAAATMTQGGEFYGLDASGHARHVGSRQAASDGLVFPADTIALAPGPVPALPDSTAFDGWWSQAPDGGVKVEWLGTCDAPTPEVVPEAAPDVDGPTLPDAEVAVPDGPTTDTSVVESPATGDSVDDTPTSVAPTSDPATAETPATAPPVPHEQVPCRQALPTNLRLAPEERLLTVSATAAGTIVSTSEADYLVEPQTGAASRIADWKPSLPPSTQEEFDLRSVRNRISMVDGVPVFAVPRLETGGTGRFSVDPGTGIATSADGGRPAAIAPFDLGWIGWTRGDRSVRLGQDLHLPVSQAIRDGRFLPDAPGHDAFLGNGAFAHINPYGLWRVQNGRATEPVKLEPMDAVIGLAHGSFLFAKGGIDARTGERSSDSNRHLETVGALTVTEALRGGGVAATYRVSGQDVSALGRSGFLFDQRAGITARDGSVSLLTPLGLVSAERLAEGLAVPARTTDVDVGKTGPLASTNRGWRQFDGKSWLAVDPPRANRPMAEESGRRWQRVNGQTNIVRLDATEDWRVARRGFSFDADRLVALAADANGPVVVTGVGTYAPRDLDALGKLSAPDAPDPGVTALESMPVSPGNSILFAETGSGRLIWDRTARQWRLPTTGEQPWQDRLAVDRSDIRIPVFEMAGPSAGPHRGPRRVRAVRPFTWRAANRCHSTM